MELPPMVEGNPKERWEALPVSPRQRPKKRPRLEETSVEEKSKEVK